MNNIPTIKLIYAYMLSVGSETNGEWNVYGANWDPLPYKVIDWRNPQPQPKIPSMDKIKEIGVDWKKTKPPESSIESEFVDTESPSGNVEALLGTLFLLDGTKIKIGVSGEGIRFCQYANIVAEFAKNTHLVEELFGKE